MLVQQQQEAAAAVRGARCGSRRGSCSSSCRQCSSRPPCCSSWLAVSAPGETSYVLHQAAAAVEMMVMQCLAHFYGPVLQCAAVCWVLAYERLLGAPFCVSCSKQPTDAHVGSDGAGSCRVVCSLVCQSSSVPAGRLRWQHFVRLRRAMQRLDAGGMQHGSADSGCWTPLSTPADT